MKRVLTVLIAVSLTATGTAIAETNTETARSDHEVVSIAADTGDTGTRHATDAPRDTLTSAFETGTAHAAAATTAARADLPLPSIAPATAAVHAELRLPSITSMIEQDDTTRNNWQDSLDQAQSKRKRGIYLTFGGLIGGPLVGGTIGVASGANEGGIAASTMISMAGAGVGVWGIYQWITAQGEMGSLEREGNRAGYVSVMPVRGGAAATLALSF